MSSKTPYKVLCVCLGNICRSPTAEVVLRQHCEQHHLNVIIDSAGTSNYHPNKAPDARSQKHAKKRGYDLSTLRARQVLLQDFIEFDLILAMDHENLADLEHMAEQARRHFPESSCAKVCLFSEDDPAYLQQAVPDPYYGGEAGFDAVLDQCESGSRVWVAKFKQQMEH